MNFRSGVAFVKPHYPFHAAYELAADLADSARPAEGYSAIDFHVWQSRRIRIWN